MSEDDVNRIVDFTNLILESSGLDLNAAAEKTDDGFRVQIRGGDRALLLGHNAELLDALEYLGNRLVVRSSSDDVHVTFDCSSYRAGREKELRLMAQKVAEKVRVTRVPFSLDPMSPNERRIVHLELADDSTVRTESTGGGADRRVTVYPA